jgi:hypothetical protein
MFELADIVDLLCLMTKARDYVGSARVEDRLRPPEAANGGTVRPRGVVDPHGTLGGQKEIKGFSCLDLSFYAVGPVDPVPRHSGLGRRS